MHLSGNRVVFILADLICFEQFSCQLQLGFCILQCMKCPAAILCSAQGNANRNSSNRIGIGKLGWCRHRCAMAIGARDHQRLRHTATNDQLRW